jgi:hypothetical protein
MQKKNVCSSAFSLTLVLFLVVLCHESCASEDAYCPKKGLPALQV